MSLAKAFVALALLSTTISGLQAASNKIDEVRTEHKIAEAKAVTSPMQFRLALLCGDLDHAKQIGVGVSSHTLANVRISSATCSYIEKNDFNGLAASVSSGDPKTASLTLQASNVHSADEVNKLVGLISNSVWTPGGLPDEPIAHDDTVKAIKTLMSRIVVDGLSTQPFTPIQFESLMVQHHVAADDKLMREGWAHEENEPHMKRLQRVLDSIAARHGHDRGAHYGASMG